MLQQPQTFCQNLQLLEKSDKFKLHRKHATKKSVYKQVLNMDGKLLSLSNRLQVTFPYTMFLSGEEKNIKQYSLEH